MCKSLENRLNTKTRELDSAHAKIEKLKCRKKALKVKLKTSLEELNKTKSILEEFEFDCSNQARDNKDLRKQLAVAEKRSGCLEKDKKGLNSAVKSFKEDLEGNIEEIARLQRILSASKKREELIKPLLDVGVSLRLRFLVQARETIYNRPPSATEAKVLTKGNEAAHRGNGLADAALFKAKLVDEDDVLARVFRRLYRCSPIDYLEPNELTMLRKALDCEASVMTVQRFRGASASASLRQEHVKLMEKLVSSLSESASIGAWEQNPSHKEWLAILESVTAGIVKVDRRMVFIAGRAYTVRQNSVSLLSLN